MVVENWNRKVWQLAGPIVLANVSVPLLGLVDTAVVGHLPGPEYIGGVAVGSIIFSIIFFSFNFLRMGTTGLTAQAHGAGDFDEVRATLARAIFIGVIAGPSETVEPLARSYFDIRIWGAPATFINYALVGWFIGIHNTRATLIHQVFMNGINIVLDLVFVMGFDMGVQGVALATLIAEYSAALLGFWLVCRNLAPMAGRLHQEQVLNPVQLRRMLSVNRNILIRSLCLQTAFVLFTAIGARMSDTLLAANAILLNFQLLLSFFLDGFAQAAEALVGGAIGRKDRAQFRAAVKASSIWTLVFAVLYSAVYFAFGEHLINLMTNVEAVREVARLYLPWAAISPLISFWSFQLDGIYIGATHAREMRNSMATALLFYLVALVVLIPLWDNHGLWASFMILMIVRAITLGWGYPKIEREIEANS
ncbi:MAG: MATE family efflux transporter [Rhodospirillales bacterium]